MQQGVPWSGKRVLLPGLAHADREEQVAVQALLTRGNDDADVLVARGIVEVPAGNLAELHTGQSRAELVGIGISTGSASGAGVMISARSIGIVRLRTSRTWLTSRRPGARLSEMSSQRGFTPVVCG